jgi:hypothetical protein
MTGVRDTQPIVGWRLLLRAVAGLAAAALASCSGGGQGSGIMLFPSTTAGPHNDAAASEVSHGDAAVPKTTMTVKPSPGASHDAGMAVTAPARARDAAVAPGKDAGVAPSTGEFTPMSLVGSYAMRITHRDTITVGLVGTASMLTVVLATADIEYDPNMGALRLSVTLCDYHLGDMGEKHLMDLTLSIPSAALAATQLDPATITVSQSSAGDMTWQSTELHGPAGWKWSSPSDALPTDAADSRVFDQDHDGNPGVTVHFTGHAMGTLYLAMVYRWLFSGTVTAAGDLVGATKSMCQETLLGSDQDSLVVNSFERTPDPDTTDDKVSIVRQIAAMSCGDVIANESGLFQ